MSSVNAFNLIIAAPGDIVVERKIVSEICWGLNKGILPNRHKVFFQMYEWDKLFPSAENPGDIVRRLADECDVLLFLFHKKFGDPSDSLKQFLSSYELWESLEKPSILALFKAANVSSLAELKDPQLLKLFELKEKIENNRSMISNTFTSPNEFCEKVQDTLDMWIHNHIKSE